MRWLAAVCAVLILASATPAIGSFHTQLQNSVPDRVFLLTMQGTSFNGLHAPDAPLLEAYLGERVRFALLATEAHTFHLHGHPWLLENGAIVDTFLVDVDRPHAFDVPAGGVDHYAGDWMYHCHINGHVAGGMWGILRVYPYSVELTLPVEGGGGVEGGGAGTTSVRLARMGETLDGATLSLTIDGVPIPAHVEPLGEGRYQLHATLPATGALVVTAEHPEHGTSLARLSLSGGELPALSVNAVHGHAR